MEGVGKGIRDIIQLSTFIRSSSLLHIALWKNVFGTCVARGGHGARRLKVLGQSGVLRGGILLGEAFSPCG